MRLGPAREVTSPRVGGGEGHAPIPELDGVRGLAILLVLLFHFEFMLPPSVPAVFIAPLNVGWSGVDLFFVLSGFLITGILIDTRTSGKYFSSFYARRVLRIFPLYLLVIFAFFRVALPIARRQGYWSTVDPTLEPWYWLYASNWRSAFGQEVGLLGPVWSLAIEEQFYLFWPLVVALVRPKRLGAVCAAVVVLVCGARCVCTFQGVNGEVLHRLTVFRLDALALGGLVAVLVRSERFRAAARRRLRPLVVGTAVVLGFLLAMGSRATDPSMTSVGYTAFALLFACLVGAAFDQTGSAGWFSSALRRPVLRALGKYSYAMYLFHYPIAIGVAWWVGEQSVSASPAGKVALWFGSVVFGIAITFGLALLSWNLVEKHFLALKRYFVAGPPLAPSV